MLPVQSMLKPEKTLFYKNNGHYQKQPPEMFCEKSCFWKFHQIHRETPVLESKACNFIKKETPAQVFSCQFG